MKTRMKQLAAGTFIAFLLLAGNVKAEGTEVKSSMQESIETALQLENWMIDEINWNANIVNFAEFVQETETDLLLEDWMMDADSWNLNTNFYEDAETEILLEDWMMNDETWNREDINTDPELTIESWMTNENLWR